jgi:hypothetical protein
VSKRASELWKKISDEERAFWDKEAEKEKRRYIIEKESYTGPVSDIFSSNDYFLALSFRLKRIRA